MSGSAKSILSKFRRSLIVMAAVFGICVGGYHRTKAFETLPLLFASPNNLMIAAK
jgi:hypothetical protein